MLRTASILIAFALAATLGTAPAYAGPTETAFLAKIAGTWTGKGKLTGGETGPIACKLVFKASGAKLSYNGRCNVQDVGAQAFSGAISYNDKTKRYEARSGATTVPGTKSGSSLVFTTKAKTIVGNATSTMTVSSGRIVVDFSVVATRTGEKSASRITFSKS
jgi:hypothetical protein